MVLKSISNKRYMTVSPYKWIVSLQIIEQLIICFKERFLIKEACRTNDAPSSFTNINIIDYIF